MVKKSQILIEKQRNLSKSLREVRRLNRDLNFIIDRHNAFRLNGEADSISDWFETLPISSLEDSLLHDKNQLKKQLSLQDLITKSDLRKKYLKKIEELELAESRKTIAQIELLEERIKNIK